MNKAKVYKKTNKMKNSIMAGMLALGALAANADVLKVAAPPRLDGRLDEAEWSKADWERGFLKVSGKDKTPPADTEFAILADAENVYVGIKAHHPRLGEMKAMGNRAIWQSEGVELYFAPSGETFDFYQFFVSYQGLQYAMFFSENGNIRPDPYGPTWWFKVADGDKCWTAEVCIPLSAFYMTRNPAWKDGWKVHVGRTFVDNAGQQFCSWSGKGYKNPEGFRVVKGFPVRRPVEDVWVKSVVPSVTGKKGGKVAGTAKVIVYAYEGGEATIETTFSEPVQARLRKGGDVEVEVPALFPENGRLPMDVKVVRGGVEVERTYPVIVDYQAIRVKIATPAYRGNFYPGQNSGTVAGSVAVAVDGPVSVSLEGPGFGKKAATLPPGGGDFSFDTRGFQVGEAVLAVTAGGETFTRKIRKLAPLGNGQHVSWIENGNLIVDGKAVLRRNMYAEYYMGGEAFKKKYDADDLCQTKWLTQIATLEPERVLKGIETREAIRDVKPCAELLAKIGERVDKGLKESKGVYYYICDEPECRQISPVYLRHIYEYVSEKDPYHVILTCSRAGEKYIDCADWFETHPYVNAHYVKGRRVYGRPFGQMGDFIDAFHPESHPDKCVGGTGTCFSYGGDSGDYPTFREYLANAWCEFLRGAKTLFPYAYHDLGDRAQMYEGTRYIFSSAAALEDILLFGKRQTLVRTADYEAALWTMPDGEKMFCVQNFRTEPTVAKVPGLSGAFFEFRGGRRFEIPKSNSAHEFRLVPLESLVATTKKRDAGLKTFSEVQAEIDAAEKERTSRDNQLLIPRPVVLGGCPEFEASTSTRSNGKRELFDGTRDVIAWYDQRSKLKFYEMSFPKFMPVFSEITVYGSGIKELKVKIREGGEWKELAPTKEERGEWSVRQVFDRDYSSVKVRLEFPGTKRVELYEIEMPGKGKAARPAAASSAPLLVRRPDDWWAVTVPAGRSEHFSAKVRREKGQKYLSFEFRKPERKPGRYHAWNLHMGKVFLAGQVTNPMSGLYTLRLPDYDGEPQTSDMIFRTYNLARDIGDGICAREPPANRVEFVEKNGLWAVRVTLADRCEDISCRIYRDTGIQPEPFSADGKTAFDMKAVDGTGKVWVGTMPIPKSGLVRSAKGYLPCPFVRATILGGSIDTPLLTWICRPKAAADVPVK